MADEFAAPLLLGFIGATGSGKTTLASKLVDRRGFTRVHMGQPIKDMLAVLGLTSEQLTGPPEVRRRPSALLGGRSPRQAMEMLGTDWGRHMIFAGLWANAVEVRIRAMWGDCPSPIVIDDLRFPSDWSVIDRLGGTLVRIIRPGVGESRTAADHFVHRFPAIRLPLAAIGVSTLHETEYHWHDAPADFDLVNGSTPEALERSLTDELSARGIALPAASG